jgi:hypothetical protein
VEFKAVPKTGPKIAAKSAEVFAETSEVMLENVLLRVAMGAS